MTRMGHISPDPSDAPVRIATIGDKLIRFYLSPRNEPDFPWVDITDVLALIRMPMHDIAVARDHWGQVYPDRARHLTDGTMIVPDSCARGLFEWASECGWTFAKAAGRAYDEAATEVLISLYRHISPTVFRDFVQRAALRDNPVELGRAN